ncbi:MAG: DUF423 domain-containing protein [Nitrospirales bacterium]
MRRLLMCGAVMSLLGVAAGAFGAHGLRPILTEQMMAVFETSVRYHLVHGPAILIAGLSGHFFRHRVFRWAAWSFILGIFIFSGSLYILSLSGIRSLGILTPFGGLAFLIGWGFLAWGYWSAQEMIKPQVPSSS